MARLPRVIQKIFGVNAAAGQFNTIGSFAAGSPTVTTDPTTMQSLSNYLTGWFGCVLGVGTVNAPCIQDMNALDFLVTRQLAYLFENGVPEWQAGTTYYTGSMVNSGGLIYISIQDTNLNHAVTATAWWKVQGAGVRTVSANTALTATDDLVRSNSTAGNLTQTLPTIASSVGQYLTIKDVGTGGFTTSVKGNGAELIDGANTYTTTLSQYDSLRVYNNGTTWDVV